MALGGTITGGSCAIEREGPSSTPGRAFPDPPSRVELPARFLIADAHRRWCRRAGEPADPTSAAKEASIPVETGGHHRLVCAACRAVLAADARATERAGAHRHLCANPAGAVYPIRLFVGSWSVGAVGSPSAEHSWFPGATWQIAVCRRCHRHLGWLFHEEAPFAGLIEGSFVEEGAPGPERPG